MDETETPVAVVEEQQLPAETPEAETPEPTLEELKAQAAELVTLREQHQAQVAEIQAEAKKRESAIQSAKDIEIANARRETEEFVRMQNSFDELLGLSQSADQGDVEAADKFQKAMRDPNKLAAWNWGVEASQPQTVNRAVGQAQIQQMQQIQAALEASTIIGKLGAEKMAEIMQATPRQERMPGYIIRLAEAAADVLAEEKYQAKVAEHGEAVKSKVLEEERRKGGGDVAQLKGGGPVAGNETQLRKQYADGDIDTKTYESRMVAIGGKP
jgi:hypothetical protein